MKVRVRLFSLYRERAGEPETTVELAAKAKLFDVVEALRRRYERLEDLRQRVEQGVVLIAVNREFRKLDFPLKDGDEVAVFPPVAGG